MRRWMLISAAAILTGAALFFFLRSAQEPPVTRVRGTPAIDLPVTPTPSGLQGQPPTTPVEAQSRPGAHEPLLRRQVVVSIVDGRSGTPVAGARVSTPFATAGARLDPTDPLPTLTDSAGRARISIPVATHVRLRVQAVGFQDSVGVVIRDGDDAVTVQLTEGLRLGGLVRMSDGSPAANAIVVPEAPLVGRERQALDSTTTADDGTFEFTGLPPGVITLRSSLDVEGTRFAGVAAGRADGDDLVITLLPAPTRPVTDLVVRVRDSDGDPVPLAFGRLRSGTVLTGGGVRDGQARFDSGLNVAPPIWIDLWGATTRDGLPLPVGHVTVGPLDVSPILEVQLPAERHITGTVVSQDGRGVSDAIVAAHWRADGDPETEITLPVEAKTDARGAFLLSGLGELTYVLEATSASPPARGVAVSAGGASGVTIVLREGVNVGVAVEDAEGNPIAGAGALTMRLGPTPLRERPQVARTDERGVARLSQLDPDATYLLAVEPPDGQGLLPASRDLWRPADSVITLERSRSITGIVRDESGEPVPGAHVFARSSDRELVSGTTVHDGTFVLRGFAPGRVELHASLESGMQGAVGQGVHAVAGVEGVRLLLHRGIHLDVKIDNWPVGEWVPFGASLYPIGGDAEWRITKPVEADGSVTFIGIPAGRPVTLWVAPVADGRSLLEREIVPGSGPLHIRLTMGKTIVAQVSGPPGAKVTNVSATLADPAITVLGRDIGHGKYEMRGLPDGNWTVQAWAKAGEVMLTARDTSAAGGTVTLKLAPR